MLVQPAREYEMPEMNGVPARSEMDGGLPRGRRVHEISEDGHIRELYLAS